MADTEKYDGFTAEERDAMKQRAGELKATARRGSRTAKADGDAEVRARIAEMTDADRVIAERIHDIVKANAPELAPKLWYGMPAYARDGKVVCFFQSAQKFKTRYATLGFGDLAQLDEGTMWPAAYALTGLTPDDEARIGALVKRAVS
ncbi:iron chaperone [Streptomyces sp. NPDC059355]|uniref:iron chaperone n=1 Tax=Streptomyces sp. NPDC059355 TaxID=3346811 RepID=UPI00368FA4DE